MSGAVEPHHGGVQLRRAAWATAAVFAGNGFLLSVLAARLPTVRDLLGVSPAQMGTILLVGSLGSIIALPLSGAVIMRFGLRRTLLVAIVVEATLITLAALAATAGSIAFVAAALFLGFGASSAVDVGMNLQGGRVEQEMGRTLLPLMHAGFSGGAILAALTGSLTSRLGIGLVPTVGTVAVIVMVAVLGALRSFLEPPRTAGDDRKHHTRAGAAWLEPRTLLLGVVVFAAGITEGGATDWLTLAVVDGFGQTEATGALAYGLFLAFLMVTRVFGTRLLDAYGRVPVLRVLTVVAAAGLALFVFAPSLELALAGVALWGVGAALGFPTGMSAASDDPLRAAARVAVVSTIGYTAFMAGPPILGVLAELVGYRQALGFILIPLAVAFFAVGAARPVRKR
ncbi:MAG TPA: MFS transporter [Actinomycetaceae bacterium]|nr:MFS transporter [Actinomycetaceae bacterium]